MTEQTLDCPPLNITRTPEDLLSQSRQAQTPPDGDLVSSSNSDKPSHQHVGRIFKGEDFRLHPISPWAPIALSAGIARADRFIGIFGLYVAFFGIFIRCRDHPNPCVASSGVRKEQGW